MDVNRGINRHEKTDLTLHHTPCTLHISQSTIAGDRTR